MNKTNFSNLEKREIKLIKEALRFVGIPFSYVGTGILFTEEKLKCFWRIEFETKPEASTEPIEGIYYVVDAETTRLSVIMAVAIAKYMGIDEKKE